MDLSEGKEGINRGGHSGQALHTSELFRFSERLCKAGKGYHPHFTEKEMKFERSATKSAHTDMRAIAWANRCLFSENTIRGPWEGGAKRVKAKADMT